MAAAAAFLALFILNWLENKRAGTLLGQIAAVDVPAFELTTSLTNSLVRFQRTLQDAVAADDAHLFSEADTIEQEMLAQLEAGSRNGVLATPTLSSLERDLRTYGDLARSTSLAMIERRPGDLTPLFERMTAAYNDLKSRLESLATRRKAAMDEAIASTRASQKMVGRVFGGVILGCLLFLTVLSIIIGRSEARAAEALRESEEGFAAFMDMLPAAAFIKDEHSRILFANTFMKRTLGPDDPAASRVQDYLSAAVAAEAEKDDRRALAEGPLVVTQSVSDRTGSIRVFRTHKFPIRLPGRPPLLGGIALDVTEQMRSEEEVRRLNAELEERVRQRTAQLEASNKELGSFSYSVSHDLRVPLRAIDGFSLRMLESYGNMLDDEGRRILGVIRANTLRMAQLIDDLLSVSNVGRKEIRRARLDVHALVEKLWPELLARDPSPPAELCLQPLPPAYGDLALVRQVLTNLLSNALKFSSNRERRIVEVGSHADGSETVFFVKDNGAGFDMKYADKLFGVFKRLHGRTEFSGTGVGLAIVERIIKRLGGRVWAEGEPGMGATFFFTLPSTGDRP